MAREACRGVQRFVCELLRKQERKIRLSLVVLFKSVIFQWPYVKVVNLYLQHGRRTYATTAKCGKT